LRQISQLKVYIITLLVRNSIIIIIEYYINFWWYSDANKSLLDEKSARLEQKEKSEKELTEESDNMNKFMEQLQQQQDLSAIFAEFDKCQTPEVR
jgi:hypothetical protein